MKEVLHHSSHIKAEYCKIPVSDTMEAAVATEASSSKDKRPRTQKTKEHMSHGSSISIWHFSGTQMAAGLS